MQLVEPSEKFSGENEKINIATERFRQMMIRHNFNCVVLNQSKKRIENFHTKGRRWQELGSKGYRYVPDVYDAYGSNALVRACALIMIGFRPNQYEELVRQEILSPKVLNPFGEPTKY